MKYKPIESSKFPGWYTVPGYPDFLAKRDGMVWNTTTNRKTFGSLNEAGYKRCCIYDNDTKTKKEYKVHVLICSAFNGRKPSKDHEVGHKDDDRGNNKASNLHWTTRKANMKKVHDKKRTSFIKEVSSESSITCKTLLW